MFNIKRALTATVLSAALAGGAMVLGASTANASATAVGIAATSTGGGECVFVKRHKLDFIFGEFNRKVTIGYKDGQYTLKKKRSCARTVTKKW